MTDKPNELEEFIARNKETFDRFRRISEAVEEEMADIAQFKAAHPEMADPAYQVEVTNAFIAEHPEVEHVEITVDDEDK